MLLCECCLAGCFRCSSRFRGSRSSSDRRVLVKEARSLCSQARRRARSSERRRAKAPRRVVSSQVGRRARPAPIMAPKSPVVLPTGQIPTAGVVASAGASGLASRAPMPRRRSRRARSRSRGRGRGRARPPSLRIDLEASVRPSARLPSKTATETQGRFVLALRSHRRSFPFNLKCGRGQAGVASRCSSGIDGRLARSP